MTDIATMLPKWVKGDLYQKITGHTRDSLKHKRAGSWMEGTHWRKGPDGVIYYNWHRIDEWVEYGVKQAASGN